MSVTYGGLDARVARLEREARIWRVATVGMLLCAILAWVVPAASAQSQTIKADTIYARQIWVVPSPDTFPDTPGAGTYVTLTADQNKGASVLVTGRTANLYVSGPAGAGFGPTIAASADVKDGTITTLDASKASASMGYVQSGAGAFRAYDNVDNTDPVWSAP